MNWSDICGEVISGSILLAIGGIFGWFRGRIKGKKEASLAVERKNEIYQPLIDDLIKYSDFDWSILNEAKVNILNEIVGNAYKYGLDNELQNKCNSLNQLITEYNQIDPVRIANNIIIDIFTKGYEKIYGSIIDGICRHECGDGDEWDEEVLVEPVKMIQQLNCKKEIESLLRNEGNYSDDVCVDAEHSFYEPIYLQLKRIYSYALNSTINGEPVRKTKPIIELKMLPEEYIACHYDFFKMYNHNEKIKQKYELREEIIYGSQAIIEILKEKIEKIVKVYEVEEL